MFLIKLFFFLINSPHLQWIVGFQFSDQGLNLGHSNELNPSHSNTSELLNEEFLSVKIKQY